MQVMAVHRDMLHFDVELCQPHSAAGDPVSISVASSGTSSKAADENPLTAAAEPPKSMRSSMKFGSKNSAPTAAAATVGGGSSEADLYYQPRLESTLLRLSTVEDGGSVSELMRAAVGVGGTLRARYRGQEVRLEEFIQMEGVQECSVSWQCTPSEWEAVLAKEHRMRQQHEHKVALEERQSELHTAIKQREYGEQAKPITVAAAGGKGDVMDAEAIMEGLNSTNVDPIDSSPETGAAIVGDDESVGVAASTGRLKPGRRSMRVVVQTLDQHTVQLLHILRVPGVDLAAAPIVIQGAPCSGKSTLLQQLANSIATNRLHPRTLPPKLRW